MAPEAKIAQVTSENQHFDGRSKRNSDEPNGQKSDKCWKDGTFNLDLSLSGLLKCTFEGQWLRVGFQKCASCSSGEHIFAKIRKNTTRANNFAKNVCVAIRSRQQKAPAIKKLQNRKCDKCCRVADRALEAQIAQVTSDNPNFDGRLKRKGDEPNGQKSNKFSNKYPNLYKRYCVRPSKAASKRHKPSKSYKIGSVINVEVLRIGL